MANPSDVNTAPTASLPYGPQSEFQVTSPIIGSVNLKGAKDAAGTHAAEHGRDQHAQRRGDPAARQRAGDLRLRAAWLRDEARAFRVYKPVADATKAIGYKFASDGTALWTAKTPMADYCNDATRQLPQHLHARCPAAAMIAFTDGQRVHAQPVPEHVRRDGPHQLRADAAARRDRRLDAGVHGSAVAGSAARRRLPGLRRRSRGSPHADLRRRQRRHDARHRRAHAASRSGHIIPFNLLPKLRTLRDGQGIDGYAYFVDGSAKIADVKIGGAWRTIVIFGEGPGGTFYQAFDVSLDDMSDSRRADSDNVSSAARLLQRPGPHSVPVGVPELPPLRHDDQAPPRRRTATCRRRPRRRRRPWARRGRIRPSARSRTRRASTRSSWAQASCRGPSRTARIAAGVAAGRDVLHARRRDGHALRRPGIERRQRRRRRDRRRLRDDDATAARSSRTRCRPTRWPPGRRTRASSPRRTSAISTATSGDSTSTATRASEPEVHRQPDEAVLGRRGAAGLLLDGGRGRWARRNTCSSGTGSDLLPSHRRQRVLHVAWRPRHRPGGDEDVPDRPVEGRRRRRRREGVGVPGGCGRHRLLQHDVVQADDAVHVAGCGALRADVHRRRGVRHRRATTRSSKNESPKVRTLAGAGRATAPFIVDQHLVFGRGQQD